MSKVLAVFDFDHTILDDNSDTAVVAIADKDDIPHNIKNIQYSDGWTAFMQGIFNFLHEKGVTAEEIKSVVQELPPVDGMLDLIQTLNKKPEYDLIIVSDSNSLFIKIWLEKHNIQKCFKSVFTNPSKIVDGKFKISPYHNQDSCKLSTKNLCKGQVLDEFLQKQQNENVKYKKVVYIGDGVNDFCPVLRLKSNDLACVRKEFKLAELVEKAKKGKSLDNTGKPHVVKPEVIVWETGGDILNYLKESK